MFRPDRETDHAETCLEIGERSVEGIDPDRPRGTGEDRQPFHGVALKRYEEGVMEERAEKRKLSEAIHACLRGRGSACQNPYLGAPRSAWTRVPGSPIAAQETDPAMPRNREPLVLKGREVDRGEDQRNEVEPTMGPEQSFTGLLWADLGIELVSAPPGTGEVSRDISRPDRGNQKEDPRSSLGQVPDEGDVGEEKSDIENPQQRVTPMFEIVGSRSSEVTMKRRVKRRRMKTSKGAVTRRSRYVTRKERNRPAPISNKPFDSLRVGKRQGEEFTKAKESGHKDEKDQEDRRPQTDQ